MSGKRLWLRWRVRANAREREENRIARALAVEKELQSMHEASMVLFVFFYAAFSFSEFVIKITRVDLVFSMHPTLNWDA